MLGPSFTRVVLLQGGRVMARQVVCVHPPVGPTQVWASLSPALHERAVRLLAQLAWRCATTPVEPLGKAPGEALLRPAPHHAPRPSCTAGLARGAAVHGVPRAGTHGAYGPPRRPGAAGSGPRVGPHPDPRHRPRARAFWCLEPSAHWRASPERRRRPGAGRRRAPPGRLPPRAVEAGRGPPPCDLCPARDRGPGRSRPR
jgi:hypothetical protein